jgi:hypothetical protein
VFDAVHADGDSLVDRSGRMCMRSYRQTSGVRAWSTSSRGSSMENWGTNTSVPPVTMPPLAITLTTSTCRSARSDGSHNLVVDQPRQHGRIAVVEQFTVGVQLVRR